jgi:cardiolipin synthase
MPRWLQLPNLITASRLALAPFVVLAILDGQHSRALALFFLAAVTDVLDGMAARHLRLSTTAGAYLDPIADKCLLSGVFLALAASRTVPWWFVAVVFGRDLYILLAAGLLMAVNRLRRFPPSVWGKAATFFQISTAVGWLVSNVVRVPVLLSISSVMLWPCAVLTIYSGLDYTRRGMRAIRAH